MAVPPQAVRSAAVLLTLSLALFSGRLPAQAPCPEPVARLVSLEGRGQLRRAGQSLWHEITVEQAFCPADSLRLDAFSRAAVVFADNSVLRLDQGTAVTFAAPAREASSWLELLRGALHFITRTPRELEIRTPYVRAAVEGTEFLIRVEPDLATLWIYEGRVRASNAVDSLLLEAGQGIVAAADNTPLRRLPVVPDNAVRWALYYPPLLDTTPAAPDGFAPVLERLRQYDTRAALALLEQTPAERRNARYYGLRAAALLGVGRWEAASRAMDQALQQNPSDPTALSLQAVLAVVNNQVPQALALARQAHAAAPEASLPLVALSYARQAAFDLPAARDSASRAVDRDAGNALAWARLAELHLALGERDKALQAARQAARLNPQLARTQTVLGFAALSVTDLDTARQAFRQAIAQDSADPLPRLGLGLTRIRGGALAQGRRDLEIAIALDPADSLPRSYLGKAYFQEQRDPLAADQLALAKQFDPKDPTPWFYDALRKQLSNQPVAALADLQAAMARNDNRAVYRSRLLLDEDQAVRGTSLARIYADLGFDRLALAQAAHSLAVEPANASAHRFLARTYDRLPRHEIARASETLRARLLAPPGRNPQRPGEGLPEDLTTLTSAGPAQVGFNEFTPLFQQDGQQLLATLQGGTGLTLADELVWSGLQGRLAYSLGQLHTETQGFRPNNDIRNDLYQVFIQHALTPSLSMQAEYLSRETEQGDLQRNFEPDRFDETQRRHLRTDTTRLGLHWTPDPGSDLLLSLRYVEAREDLDLPVFDVLARADQHGGQAEIQYLRQGRHWRFILGAGHYDLKDKRVFSSRGVRLLEQAPNSRRSQAYLYLNGEWGDLSATLGASYTNMDTGFVELQRWNPKLGLQWAVTDNLNLRLASLETVKRDINFDASIEPTQVAGFNQFYDDASGALARLRGVALDARLGPTMFAGIQALERDLNVTLVADAVGGGLIHEDWRERQYLAWLYWTPHPRWAARAEVRLDRFRRFEPFPNSLPVRLRTTTVPIGVSYFAGNGLFVDLQASYVHQELRREDFGVIGVSRFKGSDDFTVVDATLGYRLPQRRGQVSLELRNLFDTRFRYQDDNFRSSEVRNINSPYAPERSILLSMTLNLTVRSN